MPASAVVLPARFRPERLRAARKAADLTLRDVSARTGWHHSIPHRFESGEVEPRANALAFLAGLYGVDLADLFDPET